MTTAPAPFDPEQEFVTPPLYTLNLSAAQRCLLDWIERKGGLFAYITVPVEDAAADMELAESTVYEALARLTAIGLVVRDDVGGSRINARYFFSANPDLRRLVAAALVDPPITPDARAAAPRKVGNTDSRRRRSIRSV
ncbi:MarR family transcriptional regulator [Streptomyces sp. NPDC018059]|uniref:MarR family transcriptional regulator n=1 Tax=Streptomyces sp. NPDC018059 TaxID=3365041 RepID=UPI0037897AA7